jgi:hypothetical protein
MTNRLLLEPLKQLYYFIFLLIDYLWITFRSFYTYFRKAVVEERSSKEDPNDDPDFGESINAELKGSVFYVTKLKPLTLVVAYSKTKMLIEASIKSYDKTEFGKNNQEDSIKVKYLNQKKLYLTCIPRFIIKHKNPLSFLDAATKYTITFVDSVGNHFV